MKTGVYLTEYGNTAVVHGSKAFDLDMGQPIPLAMVTGTWVRPADDSDTAKIQDWLDENETDDNDQEWDA